MAESPECSSLKKEQSSTSRPRVKVKLKRSSALWEIHTDGEEADFVGSTSEKVETAATAKQTEARDNATGKVEKLVESCPSLQHDIMSQKIHSNRATALDSQACPSNPKEEVLPHSCDSEMGGGALLCEEKSTLRQEKNVKPSSSSECGKLSPSVPRTLTYERPRTVDSCAEGSGNEPPRLDAVRERCRQLLVQAFSTGTQSAQLVTELAVSIEDHIFREFKNTGTKYKNRVRSRVANLKDPRNPELRRRLMEGDITPQQLATMSAEEMASEDVKKFRRRVSEESIQRRQVPHADGTMTDMFKCENCGRENCCYNQYRGFSADGPIASPFVFCMECGNRWKFF